MTWATRAEIIDIGPTQLEVDMHDALVGATGVQFTEQVGVEVEPGIPYYKWYSRRGQYNMCQDTDCACIRTSDGDGQPWCGQPDLSFEPCCRTDCPCPASWNGQEGQHCGRTFQRNGACSTVPGTSRLPGPHQREIWRHDGLLSSIGYASPIPMCTRYDGMTIPGGSLSRSCILECLYPGLRTCPVQCRRPIQHGMNGRWTLCITNTR